MLRIRSISACTLWLVVAGGCNDSSQSSLSPDVRRPAAGESQVATASEPAAAVTPAQEIAPPPNQTKQPLPDPLRGTVKETMDSGGYTYVLLATDQGDHWAAANQFGVAVGSDVEVAGLMPMVNFVSPSLDRTFEHILFVGRATVVGGAAGAESGDPGTPAAASALPPGHPPIGGAVPTSTAPVPVTAGEIEVYPGGVTVADLFAKKAELAGKIVKFSGRVVKANRGILGSNWLHIQDGTGAPGSNDITVTSKEGFAESGSVVAIQGTLALDKDFGAGYKYDVIVEDATVTVQPSKSDAP